MRWYLARSPACVLKLRARAATRMRESFGELAFPDSTKSALKPHAASPQLEKHRRHFMTERRDRACIRVKKASNIRRIPADLTMTGVLKKAAAETLNILHHILIMRHVLISSEGIPPANVGPINEGARRTRTNLMRSAADDLPVILQTLGTALEDKSLPIFPHNGPRRTPRLDSMADGTRNRESLSIRSLAVVLPGIDVGGDGALLLSLGVIEIQDGGAQSKIGCVEEG
jgi:hypothetical protein